MPRTQPTASGLRRAAAAMLLALAASGALATEARGTAEVPCDATIRAQAFARTELFFGLSRPGGAITDAQFQRFIDAQVTPRFPAGLTVLDAGGQFRDARGQLRAERAKLLILLVPRGDNEASARVEQIRAAYLRQFQQLSVLRADEPACVSF